MDFKQDLIKYQGQQGQKPIGFSPGSSIDVSFANDLQRYRQETGPGQQAQVGEAKKASAIKGVVDSSKAQQQMDLIAQQTEQMANEKMNYDHLVNAPDQPHNIPNVEIDYANANLNSKDITAVPEGTVAGQCGIFAQNVVKLPGGGSWAVGDSIQQKVNSVARYANAGLGFYPDQEIPKVGNTVIINPGTKYGHVAVVNNINDDGTITLTESNLRWDGKVTHTRKIRLDDPMIVGYIRTE